jgi:hypothetical protein
MAERPPLFSILSLLFSTPNLTSWYCREARVWRNEKDAK